MVRHDRRVGVFLCHPVRWTLPLGLVLLVVLCASPGFAQTIINAAPTVRVVSGDKETERSVLSDTDREKNRVVIVKVDGRYLWVSRENRELVYIFSGAFHIFVHPGGAGYVKIFDTHRLPEFLRDPGPRYQYMEHVPLWLSTITYWGTAEEIGL